mmetsp:Transcript_12271/g.27067  ORF Transcript_12271/g.27067 Transcript_12271/m.27067 type:complete len:247 (-) Transcript_12271:438-1178(-)
MTFHPRAQQEALCGTMTMELRKRWCGRVVQQMAVVLPKMVVLLGSLVTNQITMAPVKIVGLFVETSQGSGTISIVPGAQEPLSNSQQVSRPQGGPFLIVKHSLAARHPAPHVSLMPLVEPVVTPTFFDGAKSTTIPSMENVTWCWRPTRRGVSMCSSGQPGVNSTPTSTRQQLPLVSAQWNWARHTWPLMALMSPLMPPTVPSQLLFKIPPTRPSPLTRLERRSFVLLGVHHTHLHSSPYPSLAFS